MSIFRICVFFCSEFQRFSCWGQQEKSWYSGPNPGAIALCRLGARVEMTHFPTWSEWNYARFLTCGCYVIESA